MPRDEKGKFIKKEGFMISLGFPSFERIIGWIALLVLLMPWIVIILRQNFFETLIKVFEKIMTPYNNEETETPKKGIFY